MKKRGNQDSKLLCWFLLYVDFLCGMNRKYKTHIVVWSNKKIITDNKTVFLFLPEHGTNSSKSPKKYHVTILQAPIEKI